MENTTKKKAEKLVEISRTKRLDAALRELPKIQDEKELQEQVKRLFFDLGDIPENAPELACLLETTNFLQVPASIKHHGNRTRGLLWHSLYVARELCAFTERLDLCWRKASSPFMIGMLHDLCKLNSYTKKCKVSPEGCGGKFEYWDYSDNKPLYPGHGTCSVLMASDMGFNLTPEEKLCIIYHMGAFDKELQSLYSRAVEKNENVLWTHTADMYASQVCNV